MCGDSVCVCVSEIRIKANISWVEIKAHTSGVAIKAHAPLCFTGLDCMAVSARAMISLARATIDA